MEMKDMRKSVAFILILALTAVQFCVAAGQKHTKTQALTEEQKIVHVLNRLGFGARPGDVEKGKAIGLEKKIDQHLNPSAIDDTVAESKVKGLEVFGMSTAEIFEKYPNPAGLLRALEGGRA